MRLFVAVDVDRDAVAFAARVRAAVEAHDADLCRRGLKWVDGGNLHLTLRFIGNVDAAVAQDVIAAMQSPVPMAPFNLSFGAPVWLPGPSRPRVLMLPLLSEAVAPLVALKRSVDERLPAGVPAEEARAYRPHLTLARVRDEWQSRTRSAAGALTHLAFGVPGGLVTRAVLFESHLGPTGPRYIERASAEIVSP